MRRVGYGLLFVTICALAFSSASANGNGAIHVWGIDFVEERFLIEWNGEEGDDSIVSAYSLRSDFFCSEEGEELWFEYRRLGLPTGIGHYHDRSWAFIRAWYVDADEFWADPGFICSVPPAAEGIAAAMFNTVGFDFEADFPVELRGAFTHNHVLNGWLTDLTGECNNGVVHYHSSRQYKILPNSGWPDCDDCFKIKALHGPTLSCPN